LKKDESTLVTNTFENPIVIPRDQHSVSRKLISANALKVLYRLEKGGYEAYLVGGGVRDMLLGLEPKDFDIATNATPEQIKALFRNCRLIGRRFRLAHIVFGRDIIEVATFRGHHDTSKEQAQCQKTSKQNDKGMLLRDNIYGTINEDAERRDFTINALYYSAKSFKIYDFANGVEDVNNREIKLIGDPETRYREDPVRMLRAIRFATKLDMDISEETAAPIKPLAELLSHIPPARMFEEFLKLFISGKAQQNFTMLRSYGLFSYLFPMVEQQLQQDADSKVFDFINMALRNTDTRIANDQRVTPAFLLAALLWYPLQQRITALRQSTQLTPQDAFFNALAELTSEQQRSIAVPKRFQAPMKDIWILQDKLSKREGKRAFKTLEHPKFRAGYDFLLLRGQIEGGESEELAKWWTDFQSAKPNSQQQMIKSLPNTRGKGRRSVRKRRKPSKPSTSN